MTAPARVKRRDIIFWVGLVAVVLLIALIGGPGRSGPAFDPRSTSGNGTKALFLLMQQLGANADVSAEAPGPDVEVTVVLSDKLSRARRSELVGWTAGGGTLVVADPSSGLQRSAPVRTSNGFASLDHVDGPCPAAALDDVRRLAVGGSLALRQPDAPAAPAGHAAVGCFPAADGYFLVSQPLGRGRLIGLGGAGAFTNTLLGHDDNSVLAADLFLPHPGTHVRIMLRSQVGGGGRSVSSLIAPGVKLGLLQLFVAFVVVALCRARRLGRPVIEAQPVELAGSELTVAVGNLLARTGRREAAAALLRDGLRRHLAQRLGLRAQTPPEQIADTAVARTGTDRGRLLALLEDRPVASDSELVELAQSIEHARQEVTHG